MNRRNFLRSAMGLGAIAIAAPLLPSEVWPFRNIFLPAQPLDGALTFAQFKRQFALLRTNPYISRDYAERITRQVWTEGRAVYRIQEPFNMMITKVDWEEKAIYLSPHIEVPRLSLENTRRDFMAMLDRDARS